MLKKQLLGALLGQLGERLTSAASGARVRRAPRLRRRRAPVARRRALVPVAKRCPLQVDLGRNRCVFSCCGARVVVIVAVIVVVIADRQLPGDECIARSGAMPSAVSLTQVSTVRGGQVTRRSSSKLGSEVASSTTDRAAG